MFPSAIRRKRFSSSGKNDSPRLFLTTAAVSENLSNLYFDCLSPTNQENDGIHFRGNPFTAIIQATPTEVPVLNLVPIALLE